MVAITIACTTCWAATCMDFEMPMGFDLFQDNNSVPQMRESKDIQEINRIRDHCNRLQTLRDQKATSEQLCKTAYELCIMIANRSQALNNRASSNAITKEQQELQDLLNRGGLFPRYRLVARELQMKELNKSLENLKNIIGDGNSVLSNINVMKELYELHNNCLLLCSTIIKSLQNIMDKYEINEQSQVLYKAKCINRELEKLNGNSIVQEVRLKMYEQTLLDINQQVGGSCGLYKKTTAFYTPQDLAQNRKKVSGDGECMGQQLREQRSNIEQQNLRPLESQQINDLFIIDLFSSANDMQTNDTQNTSQLHLLAERKRNKAVPNKQNLNPHNVPTKKTTEQRQEWHRLHENTINSAQIQGQQMAPKNMRKPQRLFDNPSQHYNVLSSNADDDTSSKHEISDYRLFDLEYD